METPKVVGASELTNFNTSLKIGTGATPNNSASSDTLDRVRADVSGQVLITNPGAKDRLRPELFLSSPRGPALLKYFILREQITHFDRSSFVSETKFKISVAIVKHSHLQGWHHHE